LSGHYILLNAQFLAAVNIIVYAGAIMVLFLFVIMFLNMKQDHEESKTNLTKVAATIVGGTVFVILFGAYRKSIIPSYDPDQFDSQIGMIENLGHLLFRDYLLPFELVSILLLVCNGRRGDVRKKRDWRETFLGWIKSVVKIFLQK
jgi:NADH-quinone oxidoreductase subunit J